MAVKKTELYSSLWASCDALRGGMDASQYKDYILTLLFMKYVTDKYKGQKYGDLTVFDKEHDPNPDPEKRIGCSFDDFIALKNKKNIGEGIDKIIARLAEVNDRLKGVIDIAHFNDEAKIGKGQEMVDKLTKLIAIFQRPELDFSNNKADGDDIIGDAYEYLMRNFATESGKSKGQFYTPAEVSRILAKVIGIDKCTDHDATVCDPACGSGSLLIRALAEVPFEISGYGQEKESSTAGLAKMNAVLHNKATINIMAGNTFSDPQFIKNEDASELERFDYIVANPPFSLKNWSDGLKEYGRFSGYGDRPPEKNGDYAWLMHILKTLKSTGKAAVILPHGVLFRGNAEGTIRQAIVDKGWIKGIISLPPNLFYGTGIPACIIIIDKEGAENRSGIFMIDAGKGFVKDGNKNRLREQDIYRIVTTFNEQITDDPKYARFVPNKEIKEKNGYNLNISRYIDSSEPEDIQDIYAHIHGGIPAVDIDALSKYWDAFPTLKDELLSSLSDSYYKLNVEESDIRRTIYANGEFSAYGDLIDKAFTDWKSFADTKLKKLDSSVSAKTLISELAENIMKAFEDILLINKYDIYQILLAYWNEVLNDDVSLIISDDKGYEIARETENIMKETKKTDADGNPELKVAGWEGKLIPKEIVISELFPEEKKAIDDLMDIVAETDSRLMAMIEESAEDSALSELAEGGKVKSKDIQEKIDKIMENVHTPLIDSLVTLLNLLPSMKKKEYTQYIDKHAELKVAYTDKGTVTKASINNALSVREDRISDVIPNQFNSPMPKIPFYFAKKCFPFEKNPYLANYAGSKTSNGNMAKILSVAGTAQLKTISPYLVLKNKIKNSGEIYFNSSEIASDTDIATYNEYLDAWETRQGFNILHEQEYVTIASYESTTLQILRKLLELSQNGIKGQKELNAKFIRDNKSIFDNVDVSKQKAIKYAFVNSKLLLIYGAAGTGKTTLINYISSLMPKSKKLFLTKTHNAIQHLRRRIENPGNNSDFISFDSFTKKVELPDYDIIFVDECSIIDNFTMLKFVNKISENSLIVLAGDINQIESIDFGNWFYYAKHIITTHGANIELLDTWRTKEESLLSLWEEVRNNDVRITEKLVIDGPFSKEIGSDIFTSNVTDEVVLCLNYDGKFGLNNINSYFQNANPNGEAIIWQGWRFKKGDKILFNDNSRFTYLYNNLKGIIVDIEKTDDQIAFTIDVETIITEQQCKSDQIEYIDTIGERTRIKLIVYAFDEDEIENEEDAKKTIIPFQLAYAVSIHKAQGLEYDSVKVIIPSVNSEKITKGVFYTAITRTKRKLTIYWSSETMQKIISDFSSEHSGFKSLDIIKNKLAQL